MRLIDVDELFVVDTIEQVNGELNIVSWVPLSQIEDAPTVEAIPVEWIKETIELAENVQASKYAEHLRILLEDWRKEND